MTEIGVLIVHGMGDQKDGFDQDTIAALRDHLEREGADPDDVVFEGAWWAGELAGRQRELMTRMTDGHTLRWKQMRSWVVAVLGDAVAYQRSGGTGADTYARIHRVIHEGLLRLREQLGPNKPLVAIGHSLGSAILSNHIWDEQQGNGLGQDAFTRMETLAGLVTFGSTLPLFTLMHERVDPIAFPGKALDPAVAESAAWHNFYDPDDILGWPLGPTSPSYGELVQDHSIEVGGLLSSWTPLSHDRYWTDPDFLRPVARLIRDVTFATKKAEPTPIVE